MHFMRYEFIDKALELLTVLFVSCVLTYDILVADFSPQCSSYQHGIQWNFRDSDKCLCKRYYRVLALAKWRSSTRFLAVSL